MLFVTIVLDGVGIGAQPDSGAYGDADSHTLRHVCETVRPALPNLTRLGLGCIEALPGVPPADRPLASFGRMREVSAGKDSTTGHWELAGLRLTRPFPTYPDGFPPDVLRRFLDRTGYENVLCNRPMSGTECIAAFGPRHQETGWPIVYTSADSVFQIAAHHATTPIDELYRLCRIARAEVCTGAHAVGRVIARPFDGSPGAYVRLSAKRKDYALRPDALTLQEALQRRGVRTVTVGKVADLFDGVGFDDVHKTRSNEEGVQQTLAQMKRLGADRKPAFLWTNLVDFDQEYGHRNDPAGFGRALEAFDQAIPSLLDALPPGGRLLITADHGNDPLTPGTDHSREYVPVLFYDGAPGRDLGVRTSFNDHAATVSAFFDVSFDTPGCSLERERTGSLD